MRKYPVHHSLSKLWTKYFNWIRTEFPHINLVRGSFKLPKYKLNSGVIEINPQNTDFLQKFMVNQPAKKTFLEFYVLLTVHPRTISQIIQLGAQRCLNIFIFVSLLYIFRASKCPSSGENYCIYATMVFITLDGWRLVCWLYWNCWQFQSNQQTRRHPHRVTNTSVA